MEFYAAKPISSVKIRRFQFPTGWNSTLLVIDTRKRIQVSIPNGMEFYKYIFKTLDDLREFQFPTGWNSTKKRFFLLVHIYVSIPNGMEFYKSRLRSAFYLLRVSIPNGMEFYSSQQLPPDLLSGFNSQRDGILPNFSSTYYAEVAFQFPTGWNSTARILPFF